MLHEHMKQYTHTLKVSFSFLLYANELGIQTIAYYPPAIGLFPLVLSPFGFCFYILIRHNTHTTLSLFLGQRARHPDHRLLPARHGPAHRQDDALRPAPRGAGEARLAPARR